MAPSTSTKKGHVAALGGASPAAMKQAKLDFSSLKRNASATTSAKQNISGKAGVQAQVDVGSPASSKGSPAAPVKPVEKSAAKQVQAETTAPAPSPTFSSSVAERPSKRVKTGSNAFLKSSRQATINIDDSSSEEELEEPQDLDVLEKSGKLNRHFGDVRAQMGGLPPVHAENNRRSNDILRVFDLSYEYGPCIGMSRLERWERACALGLNPPTEVRDILLTKQGMEEQNLCQNVFYDEV